MWIKKKKTGFARLPLKLDLQQLFNRKPVSGPEGPLRANQGGYVSVRCLKMAVAGHSDMACC